MVDRILRWYIEGKISGIKTEIGGSYTLDADYVPLWVDLHLRRSTSGDRPLKVNVLDDGETIFDDKPAITSEVNDKRWTTVPEDTMREGSIITLNIDQVASYEPGEDLTVELALKKV